MTVRQALAGPGRPWDPAPEHWDLPGAQVAFLFGSRAVLSTPEILAPILEHAPKAILFGCSTAGEILEESVLDDSITLNLVQFGSSRVELRTTPVTPGGGYALGAELAAALPAEELRHVLVLGNGLTLNGSALVEGLRSTLGPGVSLSGGLAADGFDFTATAVIAGGAPRSDIVAALGFYGSRLRVGTASIGGWTPFGSERLITRAEGNVLYELDGRPALDLYETYLGTGAGEFPAAGLRFPLGIRGQRDAQAVVRTMSAVDPETHSVRFFGEIPLGGYGRLMKASTSALIDGAREAARSAQLGLDGHRAGLALLISCVGRRQILRQRIEEETESIAEALGGATALCGFYSYGEIGPIEPGRPAELHNQTMTVTLFGEE